MSSEARLFSVSQPTLQLIRKFRLRLSKAGSSCLVFMIDKETHEIVPTVEEPIKLTDGLDDLVEELPDNSPRFVIVSYDIEMSDGRKSSPYVLLYYLPLNASTDARTLYASARIWFQEKCDIARSLELSDSEDLDPEWFEERLRN